MRKTALLTVVALLGGATLASGGQFSSRGSRGTHLELFARPAVLGLSARSVASIFTSGLLDDDIIESVTASTTTYPLAIGAGVRLRSGSFGMEGTWSYFESRELVPFVVASSNGLIEEIEVVGPKPDPATAHLFTGQVFYTGEMGAYSDFFIGVGAGVLWSTDPETDRLLAGGLPPGADEVTIFELTVNHRPLMFSASAGLEFRSGAMVLRPRLDAYYVNDLETELILGVPLTPPGGGMPSIGIRDELQPWIFMAVLDVGFRFR